METEVSIPEFVPEKMLDAESKVISCEQLVETALEPISTELEKTPQEKADILKAEEPAENIMTDYKISEDQIGNISGKEISNGITELIASENSGKVDGQNNPSSTAEDITMDAPSFEDNQQKGRPASEKLDNAVESVSDEQAGESLDADDNAGEKHSDFASSDNLLEEGETKGMELAACREDRSMEKDHDAETMLIRSELKEDNIQEDRTKEEKIQMVAAKPNIKNDSMTFENVEESGDSGHKEKCCGPNDAIQGTEEEMQHEENTMVIAMVTEEAGRQKTEPEHEKLEQKVDIALQERSLEPDETSFRGENIEDTKTEESSMLASEIPTASERYDTDKDSPAEKPAELPVVQALVREILQKGVTEEVKLKEEEKNAKEDITIENVAAEMIEQEKSKELPPPEAAVEAKDNKKLDERVECGNEMADAREKKETEVPAAAEIKETKLNTEDINLQKAELEHKKLEQDAAIAVAAKIHETKQTSIWAEEVGGMEIEKASSAVSEVPSVGKGEHTDMESTENKSGELPVIQTLVKEILQQDEIQEHEQENQDQSISEAKNPEEIVMTEDVTVDAREEQILHKVPLTEIPVEKAQDDENSNKKVDHCCYKITQENIETKIPGEADIVGENPCVPDASPTSQEFPSQNEDDKQANRVSETLSGESELSMANEGVNISETVEAMPAKASELQPEDQEVPRMAEVETRIGEDSADDSSEKVFQEFSALKTDEKELELVNVILKTDDLPVMHALVEESLQQGEIKGNKPEKAAQSVIEEKSAEGIIMTENAAANIPEEEKPPKVRPLETPAKEDIGNLDGKEPMVEVPDKEDTQNSGNLQNLRSHSLETTDATGKTETEILVDREIHDRNFDVSTAEPVAEQTSSLEEQREEPNIIPETASKEQNFDASSSWSSEIEHEKVTIFSDGPTKGQETDTNTEAEASCSQTRIDDSSVQKLHKLSELKSEEEKKTSVPENERVDDQNPFENETQVENLDDVCLQKEAEYEKLGEAEPAKTEIATVNKIHIAENESPSSVEALLEQTAEAAPSIGSEENPAKTCEETAATAGTSLQVKERESDTLDKTKQMSMNAEMAEPCSKQDESDAEKLDITYDVTPKELKAAGESADTGKEVLRKEEIGPQEGRKEMKLIEHEAAGLQNVSDMTTNQTPNEENSRAIDPTNKTEAEEAKDEDNLHQNNDNLHTSSVDAEETMQKERSGTLDGISNVVSEKQRDTFDANNNVQFDSSREEDTVLDKLKESVSEDKSHNISTETGKDEAEEKICRAVALEEMKATDGTTSKSSDLTENIQNREEQYKQIEEPAGTVLDRLMTMGHSEETEREIPEEGMVIGSATARDKNVEKSFELNNEQKSPKQEIPEPEDEDLSSNMNDNSETTIPHEVSEEPQAAGASDNIEKKTEINANEDRNALSTSCKTPNETIGEDEKKHQEATSQLYDEEQHCKANDHSDSTKEGHNEEDKDSHVVPEQRDFSTVVSNNNVETIPLRIADDPNEINDASSVKTASTDEPLVTEPDRIEATSGGTDSQKKTVDEDTILECASIMPAQDELLAESQWTKLEGATHDYQSEDQSFKANHTFKVLDEEVCEAAGAHESVEGQTTKEDGAVRDLDASVTNVALEENFEDEHKKLEGTPQTTVENQPYEVNNATDPINSNQNKEVKGSILVSKEQEFQTTDLAEEIETVSSIGEQNPEDIADALGVETTSTENMLNAVSKGLSTASGDQETQGIDKQIIHEEVTGKGVDDTFIQDEPALKTQLEKVKSKQEVEDQSSQADNKDKIPNREGCQIAGATQEDGSTKDLDASSTMEAPVDDNFPEDEKLEEGKTQAEDHIYKSNDTFDLTTTSKNEEVKVSEVVPGDREFEETGSTEMIGTMVSMGDNKLNEMTDLSPVAITSAQLDRASEEPETSSKCEDIQKQMIENVDLIGGDHEVSIKDKTAHESEESQKPKEAVPEVEAQRHHTKDELVHESDESQKLKETIPEVVAQRNHKEYELVHVGRESQKPEEAVLEVETQRRHSEDKPVHESKDSQKLEEVVPEVETQTQHTEDQKVHESEESQKPDEAVLEVEAQRYHMEDEPIHESEESQRPEEVVPEVETERHHKEDEPVYQSKESQRTEEVIPDGEAQIHHEEGELLHESEDSQKPKEAVPEVEAHRHHMEDDIVHESEDSQKLKEADPEVGAQRHHMEHEPDHDSREKQRHEEAVPEIETQRHRTEDAPICESQENQKSEEVVPEVGTQICHTEDEKVHESEENQKPKEVVTEVEAQRHHMENELFHETEESERPEEDVLEVETQRLHMADEPAHESKESQRLEEAVPEVEAQRHYIKDELVHESEENQKPKEAIPKVEAQKHHTEHEPVHEEEESQKPEEVVLEIETQRHDAKDELMHENKESLRPEEAIAEVETQIHHTEDEIVHESEESQKPEEVVLEVQAQRHHTEDEPDHKSEESQKTEEVVPDIKAQSHHTVDVSGGHDTNVENKDTEMRVVEDVAIKDLNASTAKDASIEENFHEDLKEQEKLEKANDTTQNRGNKEEYGGYETNVENKDTETHVVEEEVAIKNLSPSTKDTSIEENFNENLKEQKKEKLEEARPVLEVEDKAFEGNDTTKYGQSVEVNSAELATKEQELETRASIEKLETNTTILDKDTKQIIDTSLAEATSVENLLYASSEATGGNEEIEKQMIEEECTVKSASILEKLLQEREPKELNGETPELEAYHSYKIDDMPEITDLNIKVSKGLEAASKFENVEKQTIEEDRHVEDIDTPSNQHKAADNFLQKQEEQMRPNEATCHSDGEGHQSEVNDTSHTNDNGQSEEARASNLLPIEKDIKTTASTEKKIDVTLESNNNLNQVVNTSTAETSATEESAQEEGEKHLEATSFVSNEQEIKDSIQVIIPKEDCTDDKIEATEELVSEEEVPTKIEVPLPDVKPCKTVDAFHDSSASIQEFMEKEGPHVEVDKHIKEATDVSESTKSFVLKEEKNTNATEIEQLEKAPELGSEVITEQTIILDKRENEMGKKDEILHAEMVRNGTVSEELQNPSQTPMEGLETAVMSVNTETQIIEKKEVSTNHDTAYFEVEEEAKQTVSENENKSMEVEEATVEWEPEGLHHETKEVNVNTVKGVSIKEAYSEVEETDSSKDVEQNVKEVEDAKEEKVEAATADFEPVGPNCETKETNYITVKGDSIEEASLEVQVGGSSKDLEQKVEEEKVEEAEETTANFEADGQSCQTKEAHDYTVKGLSIKEASSEVEVDESSKDIEQKAEEGKEADKGEAEEPTAELKAEGPSHQTMEANNSTVKDLSIKKASLEVEVASSSKSSEDNEQKIEEEEEGKKENDGDATAELEPEGPSFGTKEVNIPVEGVPINFMASSELAAAGTSNDIEQKTEEEKEAKKEKAEEATAELEPEGPSCEAKEANDTTVKGASTEEVGSELEVDGSSKDREQEEEEEKEAKEEKVKEAKAELKQSGEMKQSNDITTKGSSVDETYSEIEEAGSSKDVEQNIEEVKDAKEEKVKAATADLEPVGPNCETKEIIHITVKGDSIEEASLEVQVAGASKDIEQKVEEEKVEEVEEATTNFEADDPSCQTKEAHDYTVKGLSIKEASSEVEVDESSKDIEQKAEEGKEADKGEAEEPTAELKAEGPSHQTMEANNSTVKDLSIKKASLEVEAASSSKSSEDNEQKIEEEEEGKKENDGDATAELEPEGPSCGTKEANIPVEGVPINFMASSELAAAGTSNDIEQKTEEEKEAKQEKAEEATTELEPEGPSCEAKEANDTTVKGASTEEVGSELEVDGSSKDREQEEEEEKVNEATAELKTKGQSCEMNHENEITIKGFAIDKVSSELEGDGSSKDIVEEEKEAKEEKVEEATAELKPTSPSYKAKEVDDITVEESSIKEVSSEFEVDGSTKDIEQKVEEEKEANELNDVSVGEVVPSFETKYAEDTTKNAMPNEKVKDFNSALTEQRLQTLETTVTDDKNDLDTSTVGREGTNIKDNGILNRISDISAAIGSSSNEILQKENATDATCSEPEEQNQKVDGKEVTVPATEQAVAEEIFLKEVERKQLKEVMNDETNDNETSKREGHQHTGLDSSPVPSATKVLENEGTKPDKTSNLLSEKIQETIGENDIKGIHIPMPEEARGFSSTDKEKDQKRATEDERETSKVVLKEQGPEEIHPEETTETANEEISERNIYDMSVAQKSEGQDIEVPDLGIEASSQEMVAAIDCKDPSLAESETTTLESKEGIGNFVVFHNSASNEKIHDAVLENKEVESSTLRTDESPKKSFDDQLFPQTSGEEISQKEDSKKNAGSTEILQANSSDPRSDLGEPIERTTQKALTEDLKLSESSQVEPDLKRDKVEEERQDGTVEKRMETTTEDLIEEQNESDAGKVRLFDLLERSKREKIKLPEGLVHEGHQAGKEDEVQNIQAATGQVEEEKTEEEEDDDHKKDESGSDAPVIVEAARDVDLKPTHKKSHNILSGVGSKVKHSIAKVKKAITGKSTHSKSQSPK